MLIMRAIIILCMVIIAVLHALAQTPTWRVLDASPVAIDRWDAMTWTHPDSGWIAGMQSGMYRTTDGGRSWTELTSGYQPNGVKPLFRSMDMVRGGIGWVGTLEGDVQLLHTTDGGLTWNKTNVLQGTTAMGICGIDAIDARHMVCVGAFSSMIYGTPHVTYTHDGGESYTTLDMSGRVSSLVDVSFRDTLVGLIGGGVQGNVADGVAVILRTTDGGKTWKETYRGDSVGTQIWKFARRSDNVILAAVQAIGVAKPYFLESTDDGLTWNARRFNVGPEDRTLGLQTIGFASPTHGWIGGRGMSFYATTDGGTTWEYDDDSRQTVNRFQFFSETLGYASGLRVYKYTTESMTGVNETKTTRKADDMTIHVGDHDLEITFGIPATPVRLVVYDLRGVAQPLGAMLHAAEGRIHAAHDLAPGVYAAVAFTNFDTITKLFVVSARQ